MAVKPFESDDPMTPTAAHIPGVDEATVVEMATCFAEEYLRMGWSEDAVLEFFRNEFYQATHRAYEVLGPERTRAAVQAAAARERERRVR